MDWLCNTRSGFFFQLRQMFNNLSGGESDLRGWIIIEIKNKKQKKNRQDTKIEFKRKENAWVTETRFEEGLDAIDAPGRRVRVWQKRRWVFIKRTRLFNKLH